MYTFRRPQQQQQQQQPCSVVVGAVAAAAEEGGEAVMPFQNDDGGALVSEHGMCVPTQTADTAPLLQQEQEQPQQTSGSPSENALLEEGLRYCREMILRNHVTPPPNWRRMRVDLPASIAELHLTPSAPEMVQQTPPIAPSPCVVLQLDNCVPEGMTVKEYSKSLVKYLFDLLAYQRASTAITSLRFVKIGTELSQLVVTFGRDVRLAARVLEELAKVGLRAGFGAPITESACATFQVTDYYLKLHGGSGITAEDVTALLQPTRPPLGISVVAGYEQGVYYAAVQRAETVYAWLWNPFCSFLVQHALFEGFGVLVTMADCPHEFVTRSSVPYAAQEQQSMRIITTRRGGRDDDDEDEGVNDENGDEMNDHRTAFNSDGDDDNDANNDGGYYAQWEGRAARGGALAWARNAKDEIDIFEGLDKATRVQPAHPELVDEEIIALLHSANPEKQPPPPPPEQQQQHAVYGAGHQPVVPVDQPVVRTMLPALPTPLAQQPHVPQQQSLYYNAVSVAGEWQLPQPTLTFTPQVATKPLLQYDGMVADVHTQEGRQGIKYPELVDEDSKHAPPEQAKADEVGTMLTPMQQQQQQPMVYWNFMGGQVGGGGSLYPTAPLSPYNATPYVFPMHHHHQHHHHYHHHHHHHHHQQQQQQQQQPIGVHVDAMPSILGQPVYVNSLPLGGGGSEGISGVGVLSSAPTKHVPLSPPVVTVDEACEWADRLLELVQIGFASTDNREEARAPESEAGAPDIVVKVDLSDSLFLQVPYTAAVPRMTAEIEDIMAFLEEHYMGIRMVIKSTAAELQEARQRIVNALLTCRIGTGNRHNADWQELKQREENVLGAERVNTTQLSALLPYLLTSIEGTELVSAIAEHYSTLLLPLLTRNVLPFLLDASVVQSVCAVALHADPSAENPLVQHIICHLGPLTAWLHAHIQSQAASAECESEHAPSTKSTTAKSAVVRRLTSQVGNTIDILLAAMSPDQRAATRAHLDATKGLSTIERTLQTVVEEAMENGQKRRAEEGTGTEHANESSSPASLIWGTDGALHRSLLRLYLNANLLSGLEVAEVLFVPQPSLTRDHYYFVLVAFSKSHVSPVLSDETARLCGAFLRLMEQKLLNADDSTDSPRVLAERDALHLIDTALHALGSAEAYTYLRDAYFAEASSMKRYERVEAKLAQPTPPVLPQKHHHHHHHHHPPTAILGASSSYYQQQQQQQHSQPQQRQKLSADGNSQNDFLGGWQAEWTASMRNYPPFGEPFTPLPTGWTSALSRSYGHYYYKNAKGTATYKHPTDATEFMVTPQAFLREPGVSITLADVLTFANNRLMEAAATSDTSHVDNALCITEDQASKWLQDQRVRLEALDMATLALLKISYRVGGAASAAAGRRSGHEGRSSSGGEGGGRGVGRSREGSDGRRRHHHNNNNKNHHHYHHTRRHSCKRNRSRSRSSSSRSGSHRCSLEEVQRKLRKLSAYPARGHPFPPLPRGWACNLSSSNGLYYFRPPHGSPIYQHPLTRREYRASPQTFVLHRNIRAAAIAVAAQKPVEEVERWVADQRQRDEVLDAAVVAMIPIEYAPSPDYDRDDRQKKVKKRLEDVEGGSEEEADVGEQDDDDGQGSHCSGVSHRSQAKDERHI